MKDIQKDPIQTQQAAMPQQDNSGLKVVVIILIVLFGFPLLFIVAAFVFISANFDKIADWVDNHVDEWGSSSLNSEISRSASTIYDAASGKNVNVTRDDCRNVKSLFGDNNSSAWLLGEVCDANEMKVAARDNDGKNKSIFFSNDNGCLEVIFQNDFTKNFAYNHNSFINTCDIDMKTIEYADDEDFDELEEDSEDKEYVKTLEG